MLGYEYRCRLPHEPKVGVDMFHDRAVVYDLQQNRRVSIGCANNN